MLERNVFENEKIHVEIVYFMKINIPRNTGINYRLDIAVLSANIRKYINTLWYS